MEKGPYYRNCLKDLLEKKRKKNPRFSLRAFAKSLDLNPGALSQIISGKQTLSYKSAQSLLPAIALNPEDQKRFMDSVIEEKRMQGMQKMSDFFKDFKVTQIPSKLLHSDFVKVIADWYHPAIMILTEIKGFKNDPEWIADQLRIPVHVAKKAVDRLIEVGILAYEESGKLKSQFHATSIPNTGPAIRIWMKQILEKAIESVENDPVESRTLLTWTVAIDPKKLEAADQMILEFNRKLHAFLEGGEKTHLYQLGAYLFPLQKIK